MTKFHSAEGRWAIIARTSDPNKQDVENSHKAQIDDVIRNLVIPSGLDVYDEYRIEVPRHDVNNHPEIHRLINDIEIGRVTHVGLQNPDRLGKNVPGMLLLDKLMEEGAVVRCTMIPMRPEQPMGRFIWGLFLLLSGFSVMLTRDRTQAGHSAKKQQGYFTTGTVPYGYTRTDDGSSFIEQHPEHIKAVRRAWDLLLTRKYTLKEIAIQLHAEGYKRNKDRPFVWEDKNGKTQIAHQSIARIFENPFYAGWLVSESEGIEFGEQRGQNWEPIVTSEEYLRGRKILDRRATKGSHSQKHPYWLQSLLYLNYDGQTVKMGTEPKRTSARMIYYYKTRKIEVLGRVAFHCEVIDDQLLEWLPHIWLDPALVPYIKHVYRTEVAQWHMDYGAALERQERTVERLIQGHTTVSRNLAYAEDDATRAVIQGELETVSRRLEAARVELTRLRDNAPSNISPLDAGIALLTELPTLLHRMEDKFDQMELLKQVIKRVVIDIEGNIIKVDPHSPFVLRDTE